MNKIWKIYMAFFEALFVSLPAIVIGTGLALAGAVFTIGKYALAADFLYNLMH